MRLLITLAILGVTGTIATAVENGHICVDPVTALMLFGFMVREYRNGKKGEQGSTEGKKK